MGTLSTSPRTLRGAIVALADPLPLPRIAVFQYNPDEVTRTIQPREASTDGKGPKLGSPNETISFTLELDALDEAPDPELLALGVMPALSLLEMLMHPSSLTVLARTVFAKAGAIELPPIVPPQTILVLGPRIVPIKLTSLQVTEQAHHHALAPIRAAVQVSATVLTYEDVPVGSLGYGLSIGHLVSKELLAVGGLAGAVGAIGAFGR